MTKAKTTKTNRKQATNAELKAMINKLLEAAVDKDLFNESCNEGKSLLLDAADMSGFNKDALGNKLVVSFAIDTASFETDVYDLDDFDTSDYTITVHVKNNKTNKVKVLETGYIDVSEV